MVIAGAMNLGEPSTISLITYEKKRKIKEVK